METLQVRRARYAFERRGSGPPLVLLHGFMGSRGDWQMFQDRWNEQFETLALDLLGHGQSSVPLRTDRYAMDQTVQDLDRLMTRLGLPRASFLGYSMGGRVALAFACAHPERVSALVLESGSPGLAEEAERQARRSADEALADRLERDGLEAFVGQWESMPLWSSQTAMPQELHHVQRRRRLHNRVVGLAGSLRGLSTGAQAPLQEQLATLPVPVLCLAGQLDVKFAAIARDMAAVLPRGRLCLVPGVGHNVHLEQPEAFANAVVAFLREHKR
jgi:2-succinyl-6-hydroxy-2,4-cyclohexadiene-1-carboxylate synthase